jgi:hypothetical protein
MPDGYGCVVREERFFCAVFFHLLLSVLSETNKSVCKDRLRTILLRLKVPETMMPEPENVRVFVEYAMARDLWNVMDKRKDANDARMAFISSWINFPECFRDMTPVVFNERFVSGPKSTLYIQSPARWSIKKICDELKDTDCILNACKLKWAFNIKPDVVIELGGNAVVCIEAKVESGQGQYLSGADRKGMGTDLAEEIARHSNQCVIQRFLMEDILGYTLHHVFLNTTLDNFEKCGVHYVTWLSLLEGIEDPNPTVHMALERIRHWQGTK